jgi:SAM-dependent methyltransferase
LTTLTEQQRHEQREQALHYLPEDLSGWRALDIGCGSGGLSFALAKRGAWVLGIDTDAKTLAAARTEAAQRRLEAQTEFEQAWVYDLASSWETYDLVVFTGCSQLRYPLLALDTAARKARRLLFFQDFSLPNAEIALQTAGLRVLQSPVLGTYLCEPDPAHVSSGISDEYRAAAALTARLTKTLKFRHCWVNSAPGYTETCYHDGTRVTAIPEDSDQYRANAMELGYGMDTASLSRDHEILHTFLAEALGYGSSPTLWAVAHNFEGETAQLWEQEEEESWTLAFQSYLRGGPETEGLQRLTDAGLSLETLREDARRLLR